MKLTIQSIARSKYRGAGNDIRSDAGSSKSVPGLALRIYPSGKKSFVLRYSFHGRKQLMVIGKVGGMTLDDARKRSLAALVQIANGKNPLTQRQKLAEAGTVAQLCQKYMDQSMKISKHKDQSLIDRFILPAFGTLKAVDLDETDVFKLFRKVGSKTPIQANRLLALISTMFNKGSILKLLPKGHVNPAKDISKFKEDPRFEFVKYEEMPALMAAINKEENIYISACFKLLLFTALRKSELLRAKWADIDGHRLTLPQTKAGEVQYIMLSSPVLTILDSLPRANEYILPGSKPGTHLTNIQHPWERIRKAAGLDHIRIHDLRRTSASYMYMSGVSLAEIGAVLRHKNSSTTEIYSKFLSDKTADTMEKNAAKIERISRGEVGEVVQLKEGAA